MSSGDSIT